MSKKVHNPDRTVVRASDAMGIGRIQAEEFSPTLGNTYGGFY
jgi:hypothetical protein